ncbi:MAG: sigma-70 family RNA polymerase sigma factor [Actinomycetota bacterium]
MYLFVRSSEETADCGAAPGGVVGGARFEDFFRVEYPKLVRLGVALAPDAATDLAQEALVRACRRWDEVAELDIPGAWVRRVMLNLIADHRRSMRRRDRAISRLAARRVVLSDEVVADVDREWIAAVVGLPRRQAECVALHYVDELSIAEVADVLGVSSGTVKTSLSRARTTLRGVLAGAESEQENRHG